MTDGDHVAGPAHVQVGPCEGDQAWVGHSMLVPTDTTPPWSGHPPHAILHSVFPLRHMLRDGANGNTISMPYRSLQILYKMI